MTKYVIGISLITGFLALPVAAFGQSGERPEVIVLSDAPNPENTFRENTLSGVCDGACFRIALSSRSRTVSLRGVTRNGVNAPASQTAPIEELLAQSGGATLRTLHCQGPHEITFSMSGAFLNRVESGERYYTRFFTVTFPETG